MSDRCKEHGALIDPLTGTCATVQVLQKVWGERSRQFQLHGDNREQESGTGPEVPWAAPLAGFTGAGAQRLESALRRGYNGVEAGGKLVTWLEILREEFAEVAAENDTKRLAEELVQVAAVAVSWAEKLVDPEAVAQ